MNMIEADPPTPRSIDIHYFSLSQNCPTFSTQQKSGLVLYVRQSLHETGSKDKEDLNSKCACTISTNNNSIQ